MTELEKKRREDKAQEYIEAVRRRRERIITRKMAICEAVLVAIVILLVVFLQIGGKS